MPPRLDHDWLSRQLLDHLTRVGPASAEEARRLLGVSQPSFSRLVSRLGDEILAFGRTRRRRYLRRRSISQVGRAVPIYEIAADGGAVRLATLHGAEPGGFQVEAHAEGVPEGFHRDPPWFLQDLRPAGFLGRLIPRRHPELRLPEDIRFWSSDRGLLYLARFGADTVGNRIVGDDAFALRLAHLGSPPGRVAPEERRERYPAMASDVLAHGPAGSSAGGEQPKFLALRGETPVLVKFSPPTEGAAGRRSADLLVCESVAHRVLAACGHAAPRSELIEAGGRLFLEMERFDRVGTAGRLGVVSLAALDAEFAGHLGRWSDACAALVRAGAIPAALLEPIRWRELFGELIGDSDMHPGNLSFLTRRLEVAGLAPAYDLLPMMYAPRQGEVLDPPFDPPRPRPADATIWHEVCRAALDFWAGTAEHPLISAGFAAIARVNCERLQGLLAIGRFLPR